MLTFFNIRLTKASVVVFNFLQAILIFFRLLAESFTNEPLTDTTNAPTINE
jgi:hypothetical protein